MSQRRPWDLITIAALMILFGLAEVVTSFTHSFFGITTMRGIVSTSAGVLIGTLYVAAGVLCLSMKRWAATLAIGCLGVDILGRMAMVVTGLFPINSPYQTVAISVGKIVAAAFGLYIWTKRTSFHGTIR
jgi:hypothetical protein